MRIAILQPSYLPWLGYLDQIACVDAFVFYDDVQYDSGGWRNRNRIRTAAPEGWSWLTIPVSHDGFPARLDEVAIDEHRDWRGKHRKAIHNAYARAQHAGMIDEFLGPVLDGARTNRLIDVSIASVRTLTSAFGIRTRMYRSSELGVGGGRNSRLIDICRVLGADQYLSGDAARSYLDVAAFASAGIGVLWQNYRHPTYPQVYRPFISHLSALDALLNVGPAAASFVGKESELSQQ